MSELHRGKVTAEKSVADVGSAVMKERSGVVDKKKVDHLLFGSAAGQGRPDRLQCQGTFVLESGSCHLRGTFFCIYF